MFGGITALARTFRRLTGAISATADTVDQANRLARESLGIGCRADPERVIEIDHTATDGREIGNGSNGNHRKSKVRS